MLWIILFILGLLMLLFFLNVSDGEIIASIGGAMSIISGIIGSLLVLSGLTVYNTLIGLKEEVISLKEEIDTIRSARYEEMRGKLIAGSLDNLGQSVALSDYIKKYAIKKAEYNRRLKEAKLRKTTPVYWWLGDGAFISGRVLELERIE